MEIYYYHYTVLYNYLKHTSFNYISQLDFCERNYDIAFPGIEDRQCSLGRKNRPKKKSKTKNRKNNRRRGIKDRARNKDKRKNRKHRGRNRKRKAENDLPKVIIFHSGFSKKHFFSKKFQIYHTM